MPRKRVLDPKFWTDDKIIELNSDEKLLFIGMMNFSDDIGIHKNNAKVLKAEIFAAAEHITVKSVETMLEALLTMELLLISEDKKLLRFVNWNIYQKIQHKTASKYEDEDGNIIIPFIYYNNNDTIKGLYKDNNDTIPLQHNIININKVKEYNINKVQEEDFELFYNSYPRKQDKKRAERAFNSLTKKNKALCRESISNYIDWLKANDIIDKKLIKLPTTYINGEHWNDELDVKGFNGVAFKAEDYKLDTTGNARLGYCSECYRSEFYNTTSIHKEDSKCCGKQLFPKKELIDA